MKGRLWLVVAVAALAAIVGLAVWRPLGASSPTTVAGLAASGTIEAEEYKVSAQMGGRVLALTADEGDEVKEGQVLAKLDDALIQTEVKKAEAGRSVAQAALALARAGARKEDLAKAQAGVLAARAANDGAKAAWTDALFARDDPQELDLRIAAARAQLAVSEARVAQATAGAGGAQAQYDMLATLASMLAGSQRVCVPLPGGGQHCVDVQTPRLYTDEISYQWNQAAQQLAGAFDAVSLARASRDLAAANLDSLMAQRANPLIANSQVDAAWAQVQATAAAVKEAEAALALARAGASPEQLSVAQAGVSQAEAGLAALRVQADKFTLRSPTSGMVTARSLEEGEMAIPGASLFTVANLDQVRLTFYIPESQIVRVKVGQKVRVQVDSFPGRDFVGQVTYISPQAEYTPRAVQTQEERAKTVFAVRVSIANLGHELKPGMPADATIQEAQ